MPFKDPEKRRQWERERRRKKRAEAVKQAGAGTKKKLSTPKLIETAEEVRTVLAEQIGEVRAAKADTIIKARTIAYMAGVILKAIELGELEERLAALEALAGQDNG